MILGGAAAALAATVLVAAPGGGSVGRYQAWVDAARVPTPRERVQIVREPCPGARAERSCTSADRPVIFLGAGAGRRVFLHELGHRFDYRMPAWVRARFRVLIGDSRPWRATPDSPMEKFADAYSLCALDPGRLPPGFVSVVGYRPTPGIHRAACRLIRLSRSARSS